MVPEYCLRPERHYGIARVRLRHIGDLWIVHVGAGTGLSIQSLKIVRFMTALFLHT
jgi:hypothetical protein